LDWRHEWPSIHVGVSNSADENTWWRCSCDVLAVHQGNTFQVMVYFDHYWAAKFSAEVS